MNEVTRIIHAIGEGNPRAAGELLPLVYDELRRLAGQKLAQEKPGQTLQPTALVHEAYLRLVGDRDQRWDGRGHFFAAAAEAMRRILIERARHHKSQKAGGSGSILSPSSRSSCRPLRTCSLWTRPWNNSPASIRARRSWSSSASSPV